MQSRECWLSNNTINWWRILLPSTLSKFTEIDLISWDSAGRKVSFGFYPLGKNEAHKEQILMNDFSESVKSQNNSKKRQRKLDQTENSKKIKPRKSNSK